MKLCDNPRCRQPFEPNSHHQKFCRHACKQITNYHLRKAKQAQGISTKRVIKKHTCTRCGKKIQAGTKTAMCQPCIAATNNEETDRQVFRAIIDYKRQNDGLSPRCDQIGAVVYLSNSTVAKSLRRLESAGRIQRTVAKPGYHPRIIVPGGRWIYEGEL